MNAKRTMSSTIALLLMLALTAGCGAATNMPEGYVDYSSAAPAATEAPAAMDAPRDEDASGSGQVSNAAYVGGGGRMVIKDADLELLVADTDRAIDAVTQMAVDYGGYVISAQTWFDGDFKYASLRLGVPSANFEVSLNYLRNLGLQVLRETASGQDVSAEYADLEAQLANLEATAARVREFLDQATTVEEALQVNATLSDLEGQIEQVKGQMQFYEGRAAFSTINVSLTPQMPTPTPQPTPTPEPGWNPGKTFDSAKETLVTMTQGTVDLLIWAGVLFGPWLIILALIVIAIRAMRRRAK